MRFNYIYGQQTAQRHLGLIKVAAPAADSGSSGAVAPVAAAAALSPFVGMVGQKSLINDPFLGAKGKQFQSLKDLSAAARPGDIVLNAKPKGSIWRNFMLPVTGSEFYHSEGVLGRLPALSNLTFKDMLGLPEEFLEAVANTNADELLEATATEKSEAFERVRKALSKPKGLVTQSGLLSQWSPEAMRKLIAEGATPESLYGEGIEDIAESMAKQKHEDLVLLRPKKPMTPAQTKQFQASMLERATRPYSTSKAVSAYLKDLFVPKIPGLTRVLGPQTICEGNVCSTMPAQAMREAAGRAVVPGKLSQDVLPTDYLRSRNFELVGSRLSPEKFRLSPTARKVLPWVTRGAIGASLAGGVYAGKEQPELAGAGVGAVASNLAAQKVLPRLGVSKKTMSRNFPGLFRTTQSLMEGAVPLAERLPELRRALKGHGIAAATGAGLGALGAAGISKLLSSDT